MSLNGARSYRSPRAQQRQSMVIVAIAIVVGLVCGYFGGKKHMIDKYHAVRDIMQEARGEKKTLEALTTELQSQVQSLEIELEQIQTKYKEEVPTGDLKELMTVVNKKLNRGLNANRLALVIESARPPHGCTKERTESLLVVTPGYLGPDVVLEFAEEGIVISAEGNPAIDATGDHEEAWFDAGKPVSVKFSHASGNETQKSSLLPIEHSMIVGDREYRFSIAAGARSLIDITFNHCSYP